MLSFFRLPLLVLLLATVACQRATYPMQADGGYTARQAAPSPAAARQFTEPAVTEGPTGIAGPAASAKHPTLKLRQRILARYSSVPNSLTRGRTASRVTTAAQRRLPSLRRAPAMSEDTKFSLWSIGITALLVAAGLTLALGSGAGLAVAGGIILVLLELGVGLICLYASAYGKHMNH